jgi:hypothetical protein
VYRCTRSHRETECSDASAGPHLFRPGAPSEDEPKIATTPPPAGAAGFELGAAVDAASRACSDAGKSWKELRKDGYACSGTPGSVGFAAAVELEARNGAICVVKVIAEPGARITDLVNRYAELRESLKKRYGAVFEAATTGMDGSCAGAALDVCFEDGRASASSKWTWRTGHALELSIGKDASEPTPKAALHLVYRGPGAKKRSPDKFDNL